MQHHVNEVPSKHIHIPHPTFVTKMSRDVSRPVDQEGQSLAILYSSHHKQNSHPRHVTTTKEEDEEEVEWADNERLKIKRAEVLSVSERHIAIF